MSPYDNDSGKEIAYYGEDPWIWYDTRYDVVHSLWHYTYNGFDCPCGLHAFSEDGGHSWHAYLDFSEFNGNDLDDYPAEWAYDNVANYKDGTSHTFDAAERPHLVLDEDGYTPLALTNGARVSDSDSGDYSVTLLRPINQN